MYLWDAKAFLFFAIPFCGIRKSVFVNGHCAVVSHIVGTEPALADNLRTKEAAAAGV